VASVQTVLFRLEVVAVALATAVHELATSARLGVEIEAREVTLARAGLHFRLTFYKQTQSIDDCVADIAVSRSLDQAARTQTLSA